MSVERDRNARAGKSEEIRGLVTGVGNILQVPSMNTTHDCDAIGKRKETIGNGISGRVDNDKPRVCIVFVAALLMQLIKSAPKLSLPAIKDKSQTPAKILAKVKGRQANSVSLARSTRTADNSRKIPLGMSAATNTNSRDYCGHSNDNGQRATKTKALAVVSKGLSLMASAELTPATVSSAPQQSPSIDQRATFRLTRQSSWKTNELADPVPVTRVNLSFADASRAALAFRSRSKVLRSSSLMHPRRFDLFRNDR